MGVEDITNDCSRRVNANPVILEERPSLVECLLEFESKVGIPNLLRVMYHRTDEEARPHR